jgi:hypothetical protein
MQKTLRIFQKDSRHLWPEILLTLLLTLGFALTSHYLWPAFRNVSGFREAGTLVVWMNILLPVAWWLLIARAVHDESLVGDLQFWVTRPYGWPRILAAKLLFIAVYIILPFFLAQIYLLHQAALHPLTVLPGLVLKMLLLFAFVLLPLLALSTVTASLTRMLLIYFAVFIYLGVTTYIVRVFFPAEVSWTPGVGRLTPWIFGSFFLIPAVAAVVALLQYARRRTTVSSGLLLGLLIVLSVVLIAATRVQGNLAEYARAAAGQAAPMQVSLNPDPAFHSLRGTNVDALLQKRNNPNATVTLALPVVFSGIAPGHAVSVEGFSVSTSGAGSSAQDSGWEFAFGTYTKATQIRQMVDIPGDVYAASAGKSLTVHLRYAVADYQADPPATVTFNGTSMDIPQHGHCLIGGSLDCQYALKSADYTLVTWRLQRRCDVSSPEDETEQQWIGHDDPMLNFAFDPVLSDTSLSSYSAADGQPAIRLCPGTAFTFTRYHLTGHHLIETTLPPLDPRQYTVVQDLHLE